MSAKNRIFCTTRNISINCLRSATEWHLHSVQSIPWWPIVLLIASHHAQPSCQHIFKMFRCSMWLWSRLFPQRLPSRNNVQNIYISGLCNSNSYISPAQALTFPFWVANWTLFSSRVCVCVVPIALAHQYFSTLTSVCVCVSSCSVLFSRAHMVIIGHTLGRVQWHCAFVAQIKLMVLPNWNTVTEITYLVCVCSFVVRVCVCRCLSSMCALVQ